MGRRRKHHPIPGGNNFEPLERVLLKLGFVAGWITAIRVDGHTDWVHLNLQDKQYLHNSSLVIEIHQLAEAWNFLKGQFLCRETVIDFLQGCSLRYGTVCFFIDFCKVIRIEYKESFLRKEGYCKSYTGRENVQP